MKAQAVGYWICTVLIAFVFLSGGVVDLMRTPEALEGMAKLGYPSYFMLILGAWKVLGGIAILAPGSPLLKEWAYAGMFFDLTGASASHAATGDVLWHVVTPLVIAAVLAVSWAFRPASRRLNRAAAG